MAYPYNLHWPEPIVADPSPWAARAEFNAAGYYTGNGRLGVQPGIQTEVVWFGKPTADGAQSQMVFYSRNGDPVAIVHQQVRRDGTLGHSGKPDPHWVIVRGDGTIKVEPTDD